jgi:uncharacterized protein (TIGR02246 family)
MKTFSMVCVLICLGGIVVAQETSTAEIDRQVWSAVTRTVVEDDIDGMAALYHPDGVFVSGGGTVRTTDQLAKWGRDMEEAKRVGTRATVSFRFAERQDGETTAFESGMFKYTSTTASGEESSYHVPFEALLVKKGGKWLIVMERQMQLSDEAAIAAWASLE